MCGVGIIGVRWSLVFSFTKAPSSEKGAPSRVSVSVVKKIRDIGDSCGDHAFLHFAILILFEDWQAV